MTERGPIVGGIIDDARNARPATLDDIRETFGEGSSLGIKYHPCRDSREALALGASLTFDQAVAFDAAGGQVGKLGGVVVIMFANSARAAGSVT